MVACCFTSNHVARKACRTLRSIAKDTMHNCYKDNIIVFKFISTCIDVYDTWTSKLYMYVHVYRNRILIHPRIMPSLHVLQSFQTRVAELRTPPVTKALLHKFSAAAIQRGNAASILRTLICLEPRLPCKTLSI